MHRNLIRFYLINLKEFAFYQMEICLFQMKVKPVPPHYYISNTMDLLKPNSSFRHWSITKFGKVTVIVILIVLATQYANAQISPPGLGKTNVASWFAFGIRQSLHPTIKAQSFTYIGFGRISNLSNYNPFQKPAIFVINQEFYHQFDKHWQYSLAFSYRRQDEYEFTSGPLQEYPVIQQEFRLYGRYSYLLEGRRLKLIGTFRQEVRKFFNNDFSEAEDNWQFRTRLRTQLAITLDQKKLFKMVISAEALFSIVHQEHPLRWNNFNYKESRFCLFFSYAPQQLPLVFDIGYMNNLVGTENNIFDAHYLAVGIIWENPFEGLKHKRPKPVEYLE